MQGLGQGVIGLGMGLGLGLGAAASMAGGTFRLSRPGGAPWWQRALPEAGRGVGTRVRTGLEVLQHNGFQQLVGRKVGLVANPTTILPDLSHGVDLLHTSPIVNLVAVFGPEHGFRGASQAGHSDSFSRDKRTGVPVYDIYRKSGPALAKILEDSGVDTLVVDLQDIGTRFYTYIWTLYDCMVACALAGRPIEVLVLDRPNPIGAASAEGPLLEPAFATFVGRKGIALRHGMTVGELAGLFNAEYVPDDTGGKSCSLKVVRMEGYRRDMMWEETGLPWVPPSPNMPSPGTALVYPGMGLFEGTNASEGRGTTLPFHMVGAPWVDGKLAEAAQAAAETGICPGCRFREAYFVPTFSKHANKSVGGVQLYVENQQEFSPIRAALVVLVLMKKLYREFEWKATGAHVLGGSYWVDSLSGSSRVREAIDRGESVDEVVAGWQEELMWFQAMRRKYLFSEY